jgi:hypothetical protein
MEHFNVCAFALIFLILGQYFQKTRRLESLVGAVRNIARDMVYTVKKRFSVFPSPAGDGKMAKLF